MGLFPGRSRLISVRFGMTAVPLYTQSKQARGYKAFTRQSCPTFPLCASAAGLRCIIHEHSVNLLIQYMSSLFLCLIYCLSFFRSVIPYLCFLPTVFLFCCSSFPPISQLNAPHGLTQKQIRRRGDERERHVKVEIREGVTMKHAETVNENYPRKP